MFHLLRRQMLRPYRKPLIVMSPKNLLRHRSTSSLRATASSRKKPMTQHEVRVPQLPESVADATLVAWRKQAGRLPSTRDENLVDLETDKVVLEVPAPAAGVLKELEGAERHRPSPAARCSLVLEEGAAAAAAKPAVKPRKARSAAAGDGSQPHRSDAGAAGEKVSADKAESERLAPSVRRLVEEHKLDADGTIPGSGRDGRVTKGDVHRSHGRADAREPDVHRRPK
jgi:2-oxoglutarate dehydrogenase E2 component (dihydrolipoamide succinyltransferase)